MSGNKFVPFTIYTGVTDSLISTEPVLFIAFVRTCDSICLCNVFLESLPPLK